jgi:phosphoadenosine phosphosulfate reductase
LVERTRAVLQASVAEYHDVVYSNSLGAEAMVLTDIICRDAPQIEIFTLDTGRLHDETLALLDRLERRYSRRIAVFYPSAAAIEEYVGDHGINGFYLGLDERQSCCQIRKIEPFKRAIAGRAAWVTGVRRQQSVERAAGEAVLWDERYGLWKISPLLEWAEHDVWAYIKACNLPYNPLHDKGFPSIGCAPCTRPVEPGGEPRSGRWWWESPASRECGLQPRRRVIPLIPEPPRAAAQ